MEKAKKATRYWMVHSANHGPARNEHLNAEEAHAEAKRLAQKHVSDRFFVLESVACYQIVIEPESLELENSKTPF